MEVHPNPLELSAKQSGISPSFAIWGRKSRNMKVANASEDLVLNTLNQKQKTHSGYYGSLMSIIA